MLLNKTAAELATSLLQRAACSSFINSRVSVWEMIAEANITL